MTSRSILAGLLCAALCSCGVKSDLIRPAGPVVQQDARDPSKPPLPLGEPGGTTPPYPTGP